MRIACYGFVEESAGSVASANYLVLQELLRRGHAVDFYGIEGFVRPEGLSKAPQFRFLRLRRQEGREKLLGGLARLPGGRPLHRVGAQIDYTMHLRRIAARVRRQHAACRYDALLFLGVGAQFSVRDLPTVSWLQGPPQTEWEALHRLRATVTRLSGWGLYWKLKAYYAYKQRAARREIAASDFVICGSEWSRRQIVADGTPAEKVRVLPYPIDLKLFTPAPDAAPLHEGRHTLLWLGRIDPRKRLDLLLPAFERLIERRSDVHLEVVGRLTYAPAYRRLLHSFAYPRHLTYRESIARADVPALLNGAAMLVQPSENENFGSSVAEALACGVPVVTGPTNGTSAFAGTAAIEFAGYTVEALEEALVRGMRTLETNAEAIAHQARAEAENHFAAPMVVDSLEEVLYEATQRSSVPLVSASALPV